ncbi:hypothetical protein [Streptomyces sp. NPDC051554]|uniref:hypothetical protein n=1 Tax=Streptomyces sp. NPDC051554 TaxID=3365656 RepID=UPI0037957764
MAVTEPPISLVEIGGSFCVLGENDAVDAGVAAVVGAAIGGGLAGLAAFGTSWFNLRVTHAQNKALSAEAARQRRFEGLQERREPRSKAYADLVDTGQEVLDLLRTRRNELYEHIEELNSKVRKRRAAVAIVGPVSVVGPASDLAAAVTMLRNLVMHNRNLDSSSVETALEKFTSAARRALEDDGDRPPASG